jgi:hypothetical protein
VSRAGLDDRRDGVEIRSEEVGTCGEAGGAPRRQCDREVAGVECLGSCGAVGHHGHAATVALALAYEVGEVTLGDGRHLRAPGDRARGPCVALLQEQDRDATVPTAPHELAHPRCEPRTERDEREVALILVAQREQLLAAVAAAGSGRVIPQLLQRAEPVPAPVDRGPRRLAVELPVLRGRPAPGGERPTPRRAGR